MRKKLEILDRLVGEPNSTRYLAAETEVLIDIRDTLVSLVSLLEQKVVSATVEVSTPPSAPPAPETPSPDHEPVPEPAPVTPLEAAAVALVAARPSRSRGPRRQGARVRRGDLIEVSEEFSKAVRTRRMEARLTQVELAQAAGINGQTFISHIELRTKPVARKICKKVARLIGFDVTKVALQAGKPKRGTGAGE